MARPVTRRVLQRALKPLRPELKVVDMKNTYTVITVDGAANPAGVASFIDPPTSAPGRTTITTNDLSIPLLVSAVKIGPESFNRIGTKIRIKRLEIRAKWYTTATSTVDNTTMRFVVMRSGALPQNAMYYSQSLGGKGSSYPCITSPAGVDPTTGPFPPCTWFYENSEPDSMPSLIRDEGGKRMAQIAASWTRTFSPAVDPNSAAGASYRASDPTRPNQRYMRIVIKPKHLTKCNDSDTSGLNGFAAYGHYWLQATVDTGSISCGADDFRVRMWYTDA